MIGRSTRHSSQVLVRRPSVEPTAIVLRCRVFQENRLFVFRNVRERRPQIEGHIGEYARGSRRRMLQIADDSGACKSSR